MCQLSRQQQACSSAGFDVPSDQQTRRGTRVRRRWSSDRANTRDSSRWQHPKDTTHFERNLKFNGKDNGKAKVAYDWLARHTHFRYLSNARDSAAESERERARVKDIPDSTVRRKRGGNEASDPRTSRPSTATSATNFMNERESSSEAASNEANEATERERERDFTDTGLQGYRPACLAI